MTKVTFYQTPEGTLTGFEVYDHAGYAEAGSDIVCAAISALVFNTINSVETLTEDAFDAESREADARIVVRFRDTPSESGQLLLRSLLLGLSNMENDAAYSMYLDLLIEEV